MKFYEGIERESVAWCYVAFVQAKRGHGIERRQYYGRAV